MKLNLIVFVGILSLSTFAGISKSDREKTLQAIEKSCEDSWCEGDYEFKFKRLLCFENTQSCKLYFNMTRRDLEKGPEEKVKEAPGTTSQLAQVTLSSEVACRVGSINDISDLITVKNGEVLGVNDPFYSSVTECIFALERKIEKHLFPSH